jgi:hypothetical protein
MAILTSGNVLVKLLNYNKQYQGLRSLLEREFATVVVLRKELDGYTRSQLCACYPAKRPVTSPARPPS